MNKKELRDEAIATIWVPISTMLCLGGSTLAGGVIYEMGGTDAIAFGGGMIVGGLIAVVSAMVFFCPKSRQDGK